MRKVLTTAVTIVLILIALSYYGGLPGPKVVLGGFLELWRTGTLGHDVAVSLARWSIGSVGGLLLGAFLGMATGRSRLIGSLLEGPLTFLRAVPFLALLPLSLRLFGISELGKILVIAWAAAGISWLMIHQASRALPPELQWRARSLGCSQEQTFFKIVLPSLGPEILSALKASLTLGYIVVAVAELSGVYERTSGHWWSEGLGYRMFRSLEESRDDLLLASILCFAGIGAAIEHLAVLLWTTTAKSCLSWRRSKVRHEILSIGEGRSETKPTIGGPYELKAANLTARYGTKAVFQNLSFTVPASQTLCILAKSGTGKSTLLKMIGNYYDEALSVAGKITLNGEPIRRASEAGVVFQDAPVFGQMLVWEHLRLAASVLDARRMLHQFGMSDLPTSLASTLSGGQRQRLALGTTLASAPRILLLDEPLSALDFMTRRSVQRFYFQQIRNTITTVLVTHSVDEALLLGHAVMVGIDTNPKIFTTNTDPHLDFEAWEESARFAGLRKEILHQLGEGN